MDLIRAVVPFLVGLIIFFIIGWVTGTDEYGGVKTKDDERSQLIKFVFELFKLNDERLALIPFVYPELLYLLIAVISYFVYYWIYSRRMSSNEK